MAGRYRRAFSRGDWLAVLAGTGLLLLLALPLLAGGSRRSEQVLCFNNLRQIGQAFQAWGSDHSDNRPWWVYARDGGTRPDNPGDVKVGAVWRECLAISRELRTPRILACPSDAKTRRVATDFSNNPDGGFLNPAFRANATSYFLGLDVFAELPRNVLAGDRNLRVDLVAEPCLCGINNAACIFTGSFFESAAWTNEVHGLQGNFLFNDGRVQMNYRGQFREVWENVNDNGRFHLLMPK